MKFEFEKRFGPLDEKVISALEQYWEFKLPNEYRNFLLSTNGGKPLKTLFKLLDNSNSSLLSGFFGIINDKNYNIFLFYQLYKDRIPSNTFPIARDQLGNLILLSVKGSDREKVYFWDHEMEIEPADYSNLSLISNSFDGFISGLKLEHEIE